MTYRLLITGSRHWTDQQTIHADLEAVHARQPGLTVVHGACPTGADQIADDWCHAHNVPVSRYPARWDHHGPAAGPIRNAAMVADGADLLIAYRHPESIGTNDTVRRARAAGIPAIIIREPVTTAA